MSRSDVAQKIVQTVASVPMERTGDQNQDAINWVATCMNLIEPEIMGVYIVHGPMGEILSVHLREEDADAVAKKGEKVLTWEVK